MMRSGPVLTFFCVIDALVAGAMAGDSAHRPETSIGLLRLETAEEVHMDLLKKRVSDVMFEMYMENLKRSVNQFVGSKEAARAGEKKDEPAGEEATATTVEFGDFNHFGQEDTAKELTEASIRESDKMVDQIEKSVVAETKRAVFRSLTRLRGSAITSFDGMAHSQTKNIDAYTATNRFRDTHDVKHLAEEEKNYKEWAFPMGEPSNPPGPAGDKGGEEDQESEKEEVEEEKPAAEKKDDGDAAKEETTTNFVAHPHGKKTKKTKKHRRIQ